MVDLKQEGDEGGQQLQQMDTREEAPAGEVLLLFYSAKMVQQQGTNAGAGPG
jgi:hypothetical protein